MRCIRDKGVDMTRSVWLALLLAVVSPGAIYVLCDSQTPYVADNGGPISVCIHNCLYSVKLRSVALFSLISMCMTRQNFFF